MRRSLGRAAVLGAAVAGLLGLCGGIASADDTPVWILPGHDAGAVIGPAAQLPEQALAPVFEVMTLITG
jgi:hypothetical protein